MAYPELSDPTTLLKDAMSLDGVPEDLVPSGFVESRIRQLNTMSSKDNLTAQSSPYTANTQEGADVCSPACQRTRVEVSASPPVGHSYPGLRINDNHSDDNGVAWEVASTSAHMFNVKQNVKASRSSNSLRLQSPTRGPGRFRSLHRSNESAAIRAGDTRPGVKLSRRSQTNPQASSSRMQARPAALNSSRKDQQDVLEMFDMYGVSRPEGWLSDEKERHQMSGMKTVHVCHSCVTYKSTSKDSSESANGKHEVETHTVLPTSLSSEHATAEPCLMQQLEREVLPEDRDKGTSVSCSKGTHSQDMWLNNDRQTSPRRRDDDLEEETATQTLKALLSLHTLEQDTFWTCSEGAGTSQLATQPHSLENGNQNTPKLTLEEARIDSINFVDFRRSPAPLLGTTMWKASETSRHVSPSREYIGAPETQRNFKYDEQARSAGELQPQLSPQRHKGSPIRKPNNSDPETANRETGEALGSRDSPRKAITASKSPQRDIESSDPSTWKRRLRKVNSTPILTDSSPSKGYTLLASASQRHLGHSPAVALLDEEAFHGSSAQHKTNHEEQTSKGFKQMEHTSHPSNGNQIGEANKESTMLSDIPNSDSEIPINRHICEWRSRYLGLSTAFDKLKAELDIALEHQASQGSEDVELGNASHQHQYNDYGIEGLTIIVHRRCKEDLVLNTDLREEELAHLEGEQ
ncbi:hypothetical protein V8C42DRAFT_360608 [Trichoderma barbatum]